MSEQERPAAHAWPAIVAGAAVRRDYVVSPAVYEAFVACSGDRSPIHIDAEYARRSGFPDRVMHGAILNAFVSHFVGMVFPGRPSLLLTVTLRYLEPVLLGDRLTLEATVAHKAESERVVVLHLTFTAPERGGTAVARGKADVLVRDDA
jgi:acyl dehydratase